MQIVQSTQIQYHKVLVLKSGMRVPSFKSNSNISHLQRRAELAPNAEIADWNICAKIKAAKYRQSQQIFCEVNTLGLNYLSYHNAPFYIPWPIMDYIIKLYLCVCVFCHFREKFEISGPFPLWISINLNNFYRFHCPLKYSQTITMKFKEEDGTYEWKKWAMTKDNWGVSFFAFHLVWFGSVWFASPGWCSFFIATISMNTREFIPPTLS